MESKSHHAQVILLLFGLLWYSCRPAPMPPNLPSINWSLLQDGDLVCRLGNGFYSGYFKDFSQKEKLYSHVGIVTRTVSNDSLSVVHAEASELTGQGKVRTESLKSFLEESNAWAVFRLKKDEILRRSIAEYAMAYYHQGVPFDVAFEAADSSAFYCSELVMHCVNNALGECLIQPNTLVHGKKIVAIDDTYIHDNVEVLLKSPDSR